MSSGKKFVDLNTQAGRVQFFELDKPLRKMHRVHFWPQNSIHKDIFLTGWCLFVLHSTDTRLCLQVYNKKRWICGPGAVFLPALELIQWHIPKGKIEMDVYRNKYNDKLSEGCGFYFKWDLTTKMYSLRDVERVLSLAKDPWLFKPNKNIHLVAQKTKEFLDRSFNFELTIPEISAKLGFSHSTLTHYFKKAYGVSPVSYRRSLRLAQAINLIGNQNQSVTQACYESGFSDYSAFESGFKDRFGFLPSQVMSK